MVEAIARPKDDWYRTPPECTRALFTVESFPGIVYDPFAGDGMMSAVLAEQHPIVEASTLTPPPTPMLYDVRMGVDFLSVPRLAPNRHIVGNPPYGKLYGRKDRTAAEKIIRHAIDLMEHNGPQAGKVVLILDARFLAGDGRRKGLWADYPPARVWAFSDRVTMYPGNWQGSQNQGTQMFAWFVWERPFLRPGQQPVVRFDLCSRDFREDADWERYGYKPVTSSGKGRKAAETLEAAE